MAYLDDGMLEYQHDGMMEHWNAYGNIHDGMMEHWIADIRECRDTGALAYWDMTRYAKKCLNAQMLTF